jgi:hypothetical protein
MFPSLLRAHRLRRKRNGGTSLIELICVIGIMTIVMVMINDIFRVEYDYTVKALARIDNDNGAVMAVRRMGELARGSTAVLSSKTINGTLYTTSTNALVLQVPSIDSTGNIISGCSDYVAIYRHATRTTEIWTDIDINNVTCAAGTSVRPDGQRLLTGNNSTLTFSYNNWHPYSATRVSVFLVNQKTVRSATLTTKTWTSIFLRNH